MKASKLLNAISAVAISAGAGQAAAQEMQPGIFKVAKGASQKIDRFGVCKVIKNDGANPIMVPAGSKEQWSTGGGSFLHNVSKMPGVSADGCTPWWENRPKGGVAEFSSFHSSVYSFKDGVQRTIISGGSPQYGAQQGPLPKATYYNADTGACAPANSYIGTGPIANQTHNAGWIVCAYVQLCDSDLIATPPFIQVEVFGQSELQDMPLASFDRR